MNKRFKYENQNQSAPALSQNKLRILHAKSRGSVLCLFSHALYDSSDRKCINKCTYSSVIKTGGHLELAFGL